MSEGSPGRAQHLLELVEDDATAPPPLGGELGGELEQALERGVDVLARVSAA